ncbi:MAG: glycoside hydrolase family 3 C-terminal domain-containing protein [Bacteroidales bacterium]|nr:glycoside hydrolase family 3 C-terminal domain-containing protein [Bacteroidales bacterium]
MTKSIFYSLALTAAISCITVGCTEYQQPARDSYDHSSIEREFPEAVDNAKQIISQLSLKEKLAQIQSGSIYVIKSASDEEGNLNFDTLRKYYPYGMGLMNIDFGGCPQEKYCRTVNSLKEYNQTLDHPIPIIFIGEGLHGLMGLGNTVFPQAIALGCSFDTVLLAKVYKATADEAHSRGIRMLFSPILDLAREPRFGRIEEMYSEDPYLCGKLGKTAVEAFQEQKADGSLRMAATLKHYMGHGQVEGGRNVAAYTGSANDLMNNHSIPFEMCVKAGVAAVMPAYNDVCDLPVTVNPWLLKGVLRRQFGFNGLVVSDQNAVDRVWDVSNIASSLQEAAEMAIRSGIDIDIIGQTGSYQLLENSVKDGRISEEIIDRALTNLLVLKWRLGLFADDKPTDIDYMNQINNCQQHKDLARETARKTMVLLQNNGVLPLDSAKSLKIAVIGPNADTLDYGGYTAEPVYPGVSVLKGIQNFAEGHNIKVSYAEGCRISNGARSFWANDNQIPPTEEFNQKLINQAVAVAKNADVIVLCIGENVSFSREAWGEFHRGDRDCLDLLAPQAQLAEKIKALGKPVITLIFGGRPLNLKPAADNADALVQCFYIGQEGGNAVADLIFGRYNFEGKLSVSIPHSVGSLPCYYNMKRCRFRSYIYEESHSLYPFGYGINYSKIEYSAPKTDKADYTSNETVKVTVNVKNTGTYEANEIMQLYIRDDTASIARPVKELKGFQKVNLKPGESKDVVFNITKNDMMFYDQMLTKVFEPGSFTVFTGASSEDTKECRFVMN